MAISTIGFVVGLGMGYGNIKGVGGSLNGSDVCEFILPSGPRRSAPCPSGA